MKVIDFISYKELKIIKKELDFKVNNGYPNRLERIQISLNKIYQIRQELKEIYWEKERLL